MKLHHAFSPKILPVFLLTLFITGSAFAQLGPCYHTRAKIDSFITQLKYADDTAAVHVVHVDTIGWSRGNLFGESYPLYSIKISANPDVFQDKPVGLFIGQVHAEEVVGMETMLDYVWRLAVTHKGLYWNTLTQYAQLYFVPTANPEGLEVVSRNLDYTWRKTGYHPPQIDSCRIVQGAGQDTCGVDINRNFDINWVYGDTLIDSTGSSPHERYDYYRGPEPFSEPEARAVRDLALQIHPTISAVYHSSRQGGNAAKSIAPWDWYEYTNGPHRSSPDLGAISALNELYCSRLDITGTTYDRDVSRRRYGNLQDWFYQNLGTIQFNTELLESGANIQPACSLLTDYIVDFRDPLDFLCRRLMNLDAAGPTPVKIYTYTNTEPPQPISAEWRLLDTWKAILHPWYTDSLYGRATTLLAPQGVDTFVGRKEGYVPDTVIIQVNPHDPPQTVALLLEPLPWHNLTLHLRGSDGNPISGRVFLKSDYEHWVDVSVSGAVISLPEGSYSAMAVAGDNGRMVLWRNFWLGGDATQEFTLPAAYTAFSESFTSLGAWTTGGTGNPWNIDPNDTTGFGFGSSLVTAPLNYRGQYADNLNATLTYNNSIFLDTNNVACLSMWRRGRVDMPFDSLMIEVSTDDGGTWQRAADYCDAELGWTQTWVNLTPWAGHTIRLRFRFDTDAVLGDLGYHLDNLTVYTGTDLAAPDKPAASVYTYRIVGSYPNPFNPTTTIRYETAAPGLVTLALFNTLGQEVRHFDVRVTAAGPQQLLWDGTAANGSPVGSGLYFLQMQAAGTVATHKMLLLR